MRPGAAFRWWVAVPAAVVLFLAAVVLRSWPHAIHELGREKSPLAALSALLLVGSAGVSLGLGRRARGFLWLVPALLLLAADELLMGHEQLKREVLRRVFGWDRQAMGWLGDAPMLLVPVGGVAVGWSLREHFRARPQRPLLWAALGVGAVAILLDVATIRAGVQAVEEVLEVTAETLFLLALLAVMSARQRGLKNGVPG